MMKKGAEILVLILIILIIHLFAGYFDAFEAFSEFSKAHEKYQLDEMLVVVAVLNIYFLIRLYFQRQALIQINKDIRSTVVEKTLLFRESRHRQKNNINLLLGLLKLEESRFKSPESREVYLRLVSRINSMEILYEQLDSSNNKLSVNTKDYFELFFKRLEDLYHKDNIKVEYDVQSFEVKQQAVSPLSIMLNELYTNSIKYAFPGEREGLISFSLKKVGRNIEAVYSDDGVGLDPDNVGDGFGRQLFHSLAKQLKAEVSADGVNGLKYRILFREL